MGAGVRATPTGLSPVAPPRYSLLSVPGVVVPGDARWESGITVGAELCDVALTFPTNPPTNGQGYPYWWDCIGTGGQTAAAALTRKNLAHTTADLASDPYDVVAGFTCSATAVVNDGDRAREQARRMLRALRPAAVEHELWTGTVAARAGFPNDALMDAGSLTNLGWFGFVSALGELEQALADRVLAGRTMIHAQPRVVNQWASRGLVMPNADRTALVTAQGTVVVPGHGYPGTAPTSQSTVPASYSQSYVYGTGWVNVFLGAERADVIEVGTVDRTDNDVEVRAEQSVVTMWDPCVHVGVRVSLCDEYCGPAS